MSVSDKLITEEIGQAISLLEGVLNRLQAMTQPAPVAEPTPKTEIAEHVTIEKVRAALTTLAGVRGAAHVKDLLADFNAKKLSDLNPNHYLAVLIAAHADASDND